MRFPNVPGIDEGRELQLFGDEAEPTTPLEIGDDHGGAAAGHRAIVAGAVFHHDHALAVRPHGVEDAGARDHVDHGTEQILLVPAHRTLSAGEDALLLRDQRRPIDQFGAGGEGPGHLHPRADHAAREPEVRRGFSGGAIERE